MSSAAWRDPPYSRMNRWSLFVAPGAGALLPLAFSPFDLWPLALFAPAALFITLQSAPPARAALLGWLFGLGFFGTGVSWVYVSIHVHGPAPAWLAAALTALFVAGIALFTALPCWLYARVCNGTPREVARPDADCGASAADFSYIQRLAAFSALWVLGEWFRTWFLTGFPWLLIGNAMLDTPLGGFAPLGGVYLVSLATLATMAIILWLLGPVFPWLGAWLALPARAAATPNTHQPAALQHPQHPPARQAATVTAALLLLWIAGAGLQAVEWTRPAGPALTAGFVQPNIAQQDKWKPELKSTQIRLLLGLHRQLAEQDIVIWPETALPLFASQADGLLARLETDGKAQQQAVVLGILTAEAVAGEMGEDDRYRIYNSLMGVGTASGLYHKQKLVPFGEYVPLAALLRGLISFFDLPMSDMARGAAGQPPLQAGAYRFMPFICYEIVYPDLVAEQSADVEFLVTVSNDTWFGESIGPLQHLQIARMRAAENRKPLLRGTNNGVTALIDPHGEIVTRLPQFEAGVLRAEFQPRSGGTPFSHTGSWPVIGALLAYVLLLVTRRKNAQSQR